MQVANDQARGAKLIERAEDLETISIRNSSASSNGADFFKTIPDFTAAWEDVRIVLRCREWRHSVIIPDSLPVLVTVTGR